MPVRLSAKGQVTIPKGIREILKIHSGDVVDFLHEKGEVKLKVVKKEQAKELAGSLRKFAVPGDTDLEIREATKTMVANDAAKEDISD